MLLATTRCNKQTTDKAKAGRHLLLFALCCGMTLMLSLSAPVVSAADTDANPRSNQIAVLYPDIGEPYGSVFVAIAKGIESELGIAPRIILVDQGKLEQVRAQLIGENIGICIALGRTTLDQLEALQLDIPVVRGAVLDPDVPKTSGDSPLGISLTPDPEFLIKQLKRLAPQVKTVHVVYSDPRGQALIDRASAAVQRLKLVLVAHKTEDLLAAAAMYKSVIPTLGPRDALWLPQDTQAVDDKVILPMLLNAAWAQDFILFSSNADHAKRGALFSVYPDNVAMGRRLGRIAAQRAAGIDPNAGMLPLDDLLIAVNLRTAEHLRLNLNSNQVRSFDLTFPQR